MSQTINSVIAISIIVGMFYLAYANDDRKDINVYTAPKYHYNEPSKLPAGHFHGSDHSHNHDQSEIDLSHVAYDWQAPEDWKGGPAGIVQSGGVLIEYQGKYTVPHNGKDHSLTLSMAGGDKLGNVKRWCRLMDLGAVTDEEAEKLYTGREGTHLPYVFSRIENETSKQAMIAAIFEEKTGKHLVVKMSADIEAMNALQDSFLKFCDSIKKK